MGIRVLDCHAGPFVSRLGNRRTYRIGGTQPVLLVKVVSSSVVIVVCDNTLSAVLRLAITIVCCASVLTRRTTAGLAEMLLGSCVTLALRNGFCRINPFAVDVNCRGKVYRKIVCQS